MDMTKFYNHERFLEDVREGNKLVNSIQSGKQDFTFEVGQEVSANGVERATITERYKQNGYCYYGIVWTTGKRKKVEHTSRERQQDLFLL